MRRFASADRSIRRAPCGIGSARSSSCSWRW
jgi:hypothetical protein